MPTVPPISISSHPKRAVSFPFARVPRFVSCFSRRVFYPAPLHLSSLRFFFFAKTTLVRVPCFLFTLEFRLRYLRSSLAPPAPLLTGVYPCSLNAQSRIVRIRRAHRDLSLPRACCAGRSSTKCEFLTIVTPPLTSIPPPLNRNCPPH